MLGALDVMHMSYIFITMNVKYAYSLVLMYYYPAVRWFCEIGGREYFWEKKILTLLER